MKQKKKVLLIVLAVLLLAGAAGGIAWMEIHHGGSEVRPVRMTEAEILEEQPQIAITEQDEALRQAVLAMPQVQQAGREDVKIPAAEAEEALKAFLPADCSELLYLSTEGEGPVYLSVLLASGLTTTWLFSEDKLEKTIAVYRDAPQEPSEAIAIYSNDSGGIQKWKSKHVWFAWLG